MKIFLLSKLRGSTLRGNLRNPRRLVLSAFAIGALLCAAVMTFAVRAHNQLRPTVTALAERSTTVSAGHPSPALAELQTSVPSQRIPAAYIRIRPFGFDPREVTGPAGSFRLAVDNRSGLKEVVLRLDREAGNRLHEVRVPREKLDWRGTFELTPGRYKLSEANHPNWVCTITITAR